MIPIDAYWIKIRDMLQQDIPNIERDNKIRQILYDISTQGYNQGQRMTKARIERAIKREFNSETAET